MSEPNPAAQLWLVVDGDRVLLRTESCLEAIQFMDEKKLPPSALFTRSYVAAVLMDMLPK